MIFLVCRERFRKHFACLKARIVFIHWNTAALWGRAFFILRRGCTPAYRCCFTFCQKSIPSECLNATFCLANDSTGNDRAMTRGRSALYDLVRARTLTVEQSTLVLHLFFTGSR